MIGRSHNSFCEITLPPRIGEKGEKITITVPVFFLCDHAPQEFTPIAIFHSVTLFCLAFSLILAL